MPEPAASRTDSHSPKGRPMHNAWRWRRLCWPLVAICLLLVRSYGTRHPQWIESWYSRGLFGSIRKVFDGTFGQWPVAGFYLFWLMVMALLLGWGVRSFRQRMPLRARLLRLLWGVVDGVSVVIVWFLVSWGYHYVRVPMHEQLDLELQVPDSTDLVEELEVVTAQLIADRARLTTDTHAYVLSPPFERLADACQGELRQTLQRFGYPTYGSHVRVRALRPEGLLLRLQTAGVYWFFVGEGNVDAGLHPLQMPFTITHELAHGYGIGDEGACNFLAYQACRASSDPYLRYAGTLTYWRYVAAAFRRIAPRGYVEWRDSILSSGIRNDLAAIYANGAQYKQVMPRIRDQAYSAYLHAQTNEGLESYDKVVLYSLALARQTGH